MSNCKYKLRKLSVGLVSVGTMFTTTTVLANEVPQVTATEVTALPVAIESSNEQIDSTEVVLPAVTEEPQTPTANQPETTSITVETESEEQISEATADSQEESASLQPKSRSKRSTESASAKPQLMEVDKIEVEETRATNKLVDGKNGKQKLVANRDEKQREIAEITREVKVSNNQDELEVTLTVTPKQIDEGAEVIVLLDTSKKMTEDNFNTAKENIKKLVTTLTSENTDNTPNYNNRNSVRLISFYRKVNDPISLTNGNVDTELNKIWKDAKSDWDWGVDLQGAIHKAREIFNREKSSGKRQHIVLFSQGEATFSYALSEDAKKSTSRVNDSITSSNATLSWLPIFSYTNHNANMIADAQKMVEWGKTVGLGDKLSTVSTVINLASSTNSILNFFGVSPTEYLTLREYSSKNTSEKDFDYTKRVGEGYYNYSFDERKVSDMPLKTILDSQLESAVKPDKSSWFGWTLDKLSLTETYTKASKSAIMKVIESLFYKREDIYYNHNLSALAEANMAKKEGITFYSFDVTTSSSNKRTKRSVEKSEAEKRNKKFDAYLSEMSENGQFLTDLNDKDKFKDVLNELKLKEEFTDSVTVKNNSWKSVGGDGGLKASHTPASTSWFSSTPESLIWTIGKEQLEEAFESGTPITLNYKLNINNAKLKTANRLRNKRSTAVEDDNSVTEKIISNTISYKINSKSANGQKLDDVKLTYTKEMVPVPEIEGEVIEPLAPQLPELPPVIDHGPNFDFTEDTVNQLPLEHGHYKPNTTITLTEDTKPEKIDTIIGGNVIDFTEDSITHNQYTESGHNSTNESQEIIEDTKPESDTISIGGQSDPIEITEDTLSNQSGHSNDDTIIEDTKQPEVIMGGQANIVDMVEETQSGMSGFNEATVIEEDTRPKLQFHFDNEEPIPSINKAISQTPIARVDNNLPQTGDKDKSEAFFTIAALTVIGAAGLLSKKNRKNQID
ncbi:serum opacification factor [Streptococcus dysgalactiae]|uniref:Serum opacity factor n=1 Tax=Streptococcus dysgalactiae TaxID=1334 RepID=A0A9X9SI37_STRDY|nr:Serum opacity factor [Streptococcus dysgalactiae]